MNCFECAKAHDTVAAVGICQQCGVGLCLDHLIESTRSLVGGTHEGCRHEIPLARQPLDLPAGIAATARRHSAETV